MFFMFFISHQEIQTCIITLCARVMHCQVLFIVHFYLTVLLIACRHSQTQSVINIIYTGRQFFTVEEMLFSAHHATYWECLDAGVHCFLMAIDVGTHVILIVALPPSRN